MKRLLTFLTAFSLCACQLPAFSLGTPPVSPAPLAQTTIDDKALETAWKTFDLALDGINIMGDRGLIVPGSPKGKAVAAGIRKVNAALIAAERFAIAGSTTSYNEALTEAGTAIAELRAALKGN